MATATHGRGHAHTRRHVLRPGRAELLSAIRELVGSFNEHNLLTWASATSFQIVTAIVPFLLFALALLGFLSLGNVWTEIAKNIKPNMSGPAFEVVNSTVTKVVTHRQAFWLTAGCALAIWEMSGAIRSTMGAFCEIYDCKETRRWPERWGISVLLALAVGVLVIAAMVVVWAGPLLYGDVGQPLGALFFAVRWLIAAGLLGLAVGLTVRFAPDVDQPLEWVSIGTAIVVVAWSLMSILFGLYIRFIAQYGSIYGNLATIVILFAYVYLSTIVFFAGIQLDAIVRRHVEGNSQGR